MLQFKWFKELKFMEIVLVGKMHVIVTVLAEAITHERNH